MRFIIVLFGAAVTVCASATVRAEPARMALLIGNKAYTKSVGPLKNPHRDVELVGAALERTGFAVTIIRDADYRTMDVAFKRYVDQLRAKGPDTVSFVYYSGHGAASPGNNINYLIPVDVEDIADSNFWYRSFQLTEIVDRLSKQAANATHYVVFDACRNELNLAAAGTKSLGAAKGFVPVQQTPGLLIAYATAQGATASDEGKDGGNYARALADELQRRDVEAVSMFRNVQLRVKREIGQDPWLSVLSLPEVYFGGRTTADDVRSAEERKLWEFVRDSTVAAQVQLYLDRFGDKGAHAADARQRLAMLQADQLNVAARQKEDEAQRAAEQRKKIEEDRRALEAQRKADDDRLAIETQRKAEEERRTAEAQRKADEQKAATELANLTLRIQKELARRDCYDGNPDGKWGAKTEAALKSLAKRTAIATALDHASVELDDALRAQPSSVVCATAGASTSSNDKLRRQREDAPEKPEPAKSKASGSPAASSPVSPQLKGYRQF